MQVADVLGENVDVLCFCESINGQGLLFIQWLFTCRSCFIRLCFLLWNCSGLGRPLPVPPSPLHGTEHVAKGETAVAGATPRPLPRPMVDEKLKPTVAPVKPVRQDYPSTPVVYMLQRQDSASSSPPPPAPAKPAKYGLASAPPPVVPLKPARQTPVSAVLPTPVKQDLPPTLSRTGLAKPTTAVKPVQPQPRRRASY